MKDGQPMMGTKMLSPLTQRFASAGKTLPPAAHESTTSAVEEAKEETSRKKRGGGEGNEEEIPPSAKGMLQAD